MMLYSHVLQQTLPADLLQDSEFECVAIPCKLVAYLKLTLELAMTMHTRFAKHLC